MRLMSRRRQKLKEDVLEDFSLGFSDDLIAGHAVDLPPVKLKVRGGAVPVNRFIERVGHPFAPTSQIMAEILPVSRIFFALVFTSGYFQLMVDKESSKTYLNFITPFGKFRFLHRPMGYSDSGDAFNIATDPIVKDLERVRKSINNLLGQMETLQMCYDTMSVIMTRIIRVGSW